MLTILLSIKIFRLHIKKYNIITIVSIILIGFYITFNVTVAQPHILQRVMSDNMEVSLMKERLNNSKIIGKADIPQNEMTELYYMNYSLIYFIEEFGKLPAIFIIGALALLAARLISIYRIVEDEFGKMLIVGIGSFIFIQSLISIFTILGFINFATINIPFVTHNDASIILYMVSIALIISIYGRKNILLSVSNDNSTIQF